MRLNVEETEMIQQWMQPRAEALLINLREHIQKEEFSENEKPCKDGFGHNNHNNSVDAK